MKIMTLKVGESLQMKIGGQSVRVKLLSVDPTTGRNSLKWTHGTRLGLEADRGLSIHREEVYSSIKGGRK